MEIETSTGFVSLGITLGLCFACGLLAFWFHQRRAFQPIRSRFWWLSEFITLTAVVWATWLAVALEFPSLGQTFLLFAYAFLMNAAFAVLIRLVHIYSAYEVAAVYAAWNSSDGGDDIGTRLANGGFYVRHAATVQRPLIQGIAMIIHTAFQGAIWGVAAVTIGEFTVEEELLGTGVLLFCYVAPMGYLAWKIVSLEDGLYLRREMIAIAIVGTIVAVSFTASRLSVDARFLNYAIVLYGLPFPVIAILIAFPLYKSYVWEAEAKRYMAEGGHDAPFESMNVESSSSNSHHRKSNVSDLFPRRPSNFEVAVGEHLDGGELSGRRAVPKLELAQVLVQPAGRIAFITFCKLELNHETVLFFLDATKYVRLALNKRTVPAPEELRLKATELYETYIREGSVLEVNIGHRIRNRFTAAGIGGNAEEGAEFDAQAALKAIRMARDEVYRLMVGGPYVRFLRHKLYEDFIGTRAEA